MRGALLNDADLRRAWLRGPESLEKTDLRGAKLLETRIVDAVFAGVDLDDAGLEGAYLIGADLSGARNLAKARLVNARYDDNTTWPEDFEAQEVGAKPIHDERNDLLRRLGEDNKKWYVDADGALRSR